MRAVISRFKVANGMEGEVRTAFQRRAHQVDGEPGFLGLEVFTDPADPSIFYLLTRWTDEASFETWHGSAAHRASHQGIPRGLKLAPSFTEVRQLERLTAADASDALENLVADRVPLIARLLDSSASLCLLAADPAGVVQFCSPALLARLGRSADGVVGHEISSLLTEDDGAALREHLDGSRPDGRMLLNFVDGRQAPFTLDCLVAVQPNGLTVLGEPPARRDDESATELMRLNNDFATLSREHARKSRELARAHAEIERVLADLKSSHWLLKKLQEVLPICMECGRVSAAEGWQDVATYLKQHALFLSHGYCPDCVVQVEARWLKEEG
jgi:heme oxygenase (mycobilin-producing)